jgi:hypothetical protein
MIHFSYDTQSGRQNRAGKHGHLGGEQQQA